MASFCRKNHQKMFQPADSLRTAALWGAFFFLCAAKLQADQDLTDLSLDQLIKIEVQTASLHSQDIAIAPGLVTVIRLNR